MREAPSNEAWVGAAVRSLRDVDSWTGRIHIHKLFAIVDLLDLAKQPFPFELYYYGPYSRELDCTIASMDMRGLLEHEYPKPGYGPRYNLIEDRPSLDVDTATIRRVANAICKYDSRSLELIATCLWVKHREGLDDDAEIVERVRSLKPRYNDDKVKQGLNEARQLEAALLKR